MCLTDLANPMKAAREVGIICSARAAIRVAPLLSRAFDDDPERDRKGASRIAGEVVLPVLRAMATPWVVARYPKRETRELAAAAVSACAGASRSFYFSSFAVSCVARAAAAASATGAPARTWVSYSGSAVQDAAAAALALSPAAREESDGAAAADTESIAHGLGAAALAARPLWLNGTPGWAHDEWNRLQQGLRRSDYQHWDVWTAWYRDRLEGRPAIEDLEVARVLISDRTWNESPAGVNSEITRLMEIYGPHKPLADIPSAFGFGWTDHGTIMIVSSPANWPIFPLPTSESDHRKRLEACRILAKDIIAALKAQTYQARGEYAKGLSKYTSRLPENPGDGNILLADAEARTLRNLFAAEAEILPPGLASQLKTFLEQHIGLRPYYPEVEKFYRDVQSGHIEAPLPQDAVEGFVRGVKNNTPSLFDASVSNAVDASATPAPTISLPQPDERPPSKPDQPIPPADPLKEIDPKRARDFMFGGVVNALWKVYLEGEKIPKAADGWRKAGDALQPYVEPILAWLRAFTGH
jgi:hypothetical protein